MYQDLPLEDLQEQAEHLKRRLIDRYVKIQKHQLAESIEQAKSEKDIQKLLGKVDKLNRLIKQTTP
jgi:hypothetical protein